MKTNYLLIALISISLFTSCSASRKLKKEVTSTLTNTLPFKNAQTGISIYEPATGKFWLNYQGDKYFVPASNTKLVTCYAAMKYLGDSLAGLYYTETDNSIYLRGTGDPTFLHADFHSENVLNFLTAAQKTLFVDTLAFHEAKWGPGWSWDDYSDYYMVDKTDFPVYGNILTLSGTLNNLKSIPAYFGESVSVSDSLNTFLYPGNVRRDIDANIFKVTETNSTVHYTETPFSRSDRSLLLRLLEDTLHKKVFAGVSPVQEKNQVIYSQPVDSMLTILMHRSDNFFAEQTLLMVSDKVLGEMDDQKIIATLLKNDFSDLPDPPKWVDGSGLSHYNLFSPRDFVKILEKMKDNFGMDRIKKILATGGTGTIKYYYKADSGFIYAKTGTLTGVVALSGFLYTRKNKLLIFSTLVNNHNSSAAAIRKEIEKFIEGVRNKN